MKQILVHSSYKDGELVGDKDKAVMIGSTGMQFFALPGQKFWLIEAKVITSALRRNEGGSA